ncbi:DUF3810 domain-containing protein [Lachnospiraceae bacterium]|nr:DUF3810 domain-containing protein [Lachnospiraceae bacterium]
MGKKRRRLWMGIILAIALVLNIVAWKSPAFCDFYVKNVYPLWVNTYGRFMGIFPFSVGEIMFAVGVLLTTAAFILALGCAIALFYKQIKCMGENGSRIGRFCRIYFAAYGWIFTGVVVVMTLNCFIPYHCSTLEEKYGVLCREIEEEFPVEELLFKEYSLDELIRLRDYVVIKVNELAQKVERDENGNIVFPENMEEIAIECMQELSGECGQLAGFYPQPKQFTFSGFFSQQYMKGYFFPFSMEVNYNKLMHEINRPATVCHEYAHLKGFMYEEEANMIGFLACINSSDEVFQYSGYLSVLNYIDNEFYKAIGKDKEVYLSHVNISPLVKSENIFLKAETWEKVEEKAVLKTEVVDKVSDKLSETSMVLNGVEDGVLSYTRVVGLLLHYYDGASEVDETLLKAQGDAYFEDTEMAMGGME